MKRFDIVRPSKYTAKSGEEKTAWRPVGTIVQFENGGLGLELNHTSEIYKVFEQKPKSPAAGIPQGTPVAQQPLVEGDEGFIKASDIPF